MEKTWLEQPRLCSVWVHRTVRWCTGPCPVRQRSAAQSARDTWPSQRSDGGTGLSGVHRAVSGAPMAPNRQRSAALE
jgi:hypothetical protein